MAIALGGVTPLLEVFDLPASIAFYRDVLGFALVSGDETFWCMLRSGDTTLMLNTAYEPGGRPPEPEPRRVRGHGDTSLYFDADPDAVYAHLCENSWPVNEPTDMSYGMRQVSTKDPDGFQLCFIRPTGSR